MRRLVLHIDRIVLDGLTPPDLHAFGQGLQDALSAALADPQTQQAWARQPGSARIDAGSLRVAAGTGAAELGARTGSYIAGRPRR